MMRQLAVMVVVAAMGAGAGAVWAQEMEIQPNGPVFVPWIELPHLGMVPMPPMAQDGEEGQEQGESSEPLDPNSPAAQQVESALAAVNEGQPATRDAAEDKLAAYGAKAVLALKDAVGKYAGFKRAAAEGALFRISNGIKPQETIGAWIKKNVEGQRAKRERISDALLGEVFPHHLFYVLTFGEKAKLPAAGGIKTRTVIVMAADGKVQAITEDGALAKFLAVEGGVLKSAGERARVAEAAVLLACGREAGGYPELDEIVTSEDKEVVTAVGANKKATVTVAVTVSGGRVSGVKVTRGAAAEKKAGAAGGDEGGAGGGGGGAATVPGVGRGGAGAVVVPEVVVPRGE